MASAIPTIRGVVIVDLLNRRHYADFNTVLFIPVNWIAILSIALGIVAEHYAPSILPVNAVLGGVFSYILFHFAIAALPPPPSEIDHAE